MFWRYSSVRHDRAIDGFWRSWVGSGPIDRFIKWTILGFALWLCAGLIAAAGAKELGIIVAIAGTLTWAVWLVDLSMEHNLTRSTVTGLTGRPDTILATRAEYIGGHPQLPHGRFVYLTIDGTQEDPMLTILLPAPEGQRWERFSMPILDLEKTKPESQPGEESLAQSLVSLVEKAPKLFGGDRVTLQIRYSSDGGRKQSVELTSFWRGNDEIRNWRNYIVCAQAEGDTGVTPHSPWKSLKPAHELALQPQLPPRPPAAPRGRDPFSPPPQTPRPENLNGSSGKSVPERERSSPFVRR